MTRGQGFLGLALLPLFVSSVAAAQEAAATRAPLIAAPPHLMLRLPEPASTTDADKRWLLIPLTLTPSPLLAATLEATTPLQTADGERSTYVAFAPLAAAGPVTLSAQGAVAPKIELDCRSTCQEQVERSLALAAQVVVAGTAQQPDAAVYVRSEQLSAQPNAERRLRVGVLGAF